MEQGKVAVLGFGTMGSEIALLAALAGYEVFGFDPFPQAFDRQMPHLEAHISRQKRLSDEEKAAALARLKTTSNLSDIRGAEFVIEASLELKEIKEGLLASLSEYLDEKAILATNTSSMSISGLASVYQYPNRFLGMHFFNPALTMTLVEVVPGTLTDPDVVDSAVAFCEKIGKTPIRVKETPGFVVNRVLIALMFEAMSLLDEGIATVEDIDIAMRRGAGFPLGPFKLADLVGLDVLLHAGEVLYSELGHPKFKPPYSLKCMVASGLLGRKSGRGFYDYSKESEQQA
ncbi:MAG: 3-hydroxyacyl-CoA dehydrogenase family protein [bacterium]|jgi:3-hydroxybutyryl-CoA dehydrogenase